MKSSTCPSARHYLQAMRNLLARIGTDSIETLTDRVYETWRSDRHVLAFGNGGSAATASHFVTDLVKTASVDGTRRIRAICLNDNTGLTTAIANDIDYDHTFVYPLETYGRPDDVALAISASGNSPNVVIACKRAKQLGLYVAAITGFNGGQLASIVDIHVNVPSHNYGLVEDMHLSIGHIVAQGLKARVERTKCMRGSTK